jgi:GWxTD domain-containing protein
MARRVISLVPIILAASIFAAAHTRTASQNDSSSAAENGELSRLPVLYRYWLTEDVPYIIASVEREAFLQLANDQERDQFIEQFWQRRYPVPIYEENPFEEEHYRRIAYSNDHFSTDLRGWRTDRGRIYIAWGPPDEIRDMPYPDSQSSESLQIWQYRSLDGIGENVGVKFTHIRGFPDYQLSVSSAFATKLADLPQIGNSVHVTAARADSIYAAPGFKALEAVVTAHLFRTTIGFDHRVEFAPITHFTTAVLLTIEVPKLEFHRQAAQPNETPGLNVFCRVSNTNGRIVEGFYESVVQGDAAPEDSAGLYFLRKSVLLRPGSYAVAIVVNDPKSGDVGTFYTTLQVPPLETTE